MSSYGRPTQEEIDEENNRACEQTERGGSTCPGQSYEEGVAAALDWVSGNREDKPMDEGRVT